MFPRILLSSVARQSQKMLALRNISSTQALQQTFKNHSPNGLEKRFLVWTGKYKSVQEVPSFVSQDEMERVRNKVRIRLANIMMALTALGCVFMVYSGKQAAKRGESVTKMNLDWHAKYNESQQKNSTATAPTQN